VGKTRSETKPWQSRHFGEDQPTNADSFSYASINIMQADRISSAVLYLPTPNRTLRLAIGSVSPNAVKT
jgi:hypothetical protein